MLVGVLVGGNTLVSGESRVTKKHLSLHIISYFIYKSNVIRRFSNITLRVLHFRDEIRGFVYSARIDFVPLVN